MKMQVKRLAGLLVIVCVVALSGCSRVAIYKNEALEGAATGVKFYYPKPYLLVARTGAKDNPVQVSVIYLPDQSQAFYAELKSGYGSADLSLTLQNGMLTNIGQKTDTKIPETVTALAGMATAAKGLIPQAAPSYELISANLEKMAKGLTALLRDAKDLTPNERETGKLAVGLIRKAGSLLEDPVNAESNLQAAVSYLKNALNNLRPMAGDATPTRTAIKAYCSELQTIIDSLSPKPAEAPAFILYEIDNRSGVTILKEVKF
jgi:hypothetical protein